MNFLAESKHKVIFPKFSSKHQLELSKSSQAHLYQLTGDCELSGLAHHMWRGVVRHEYTKPQMAWLAYIFKKKKLKTQKNQENWKI